MTRIQYEAQLFALRDFYAERLPHAPPAQAQRIQAHIAALELSIEMPSRSQFFHFLATAHSRVFPSFSRLVSQSPAGLASVPAGQQISGPLMNWYSMRTHDETAYVSLRSDIGCYGRKSSDFAAELGHPRKVELFIDSAGGDTICSLNLHEMLRGLDVDVLISGQCCSAAVLVAMAGKVVRIQRGANIMIHAPVCYSFGTPEKLHADAQTLAGWTEETLAIIVRESQQTESVVREWFRKDTWFTAEEALAAGLVDEIVEPPRLMRKSDDGPVLAPMNGPTEDERFLQAMLTGLGAIQVCDKTAFVEWLKGWLRKNVKGS